MGFTILRDIQEIKGPEESMEDIPKKDQLWYPNVIKVCL